MLKKCAPKRFDTLTREEQRLFATLQDRLQLAPELALPRTKGFSAFHTYAYEKQIGCVFMQETQDGAKRHSGFGQDR